MPVCGRAFEVQISRERARSVHAPWLALSCAMDGGHCPPGRSPRLASGRRRRDPRWWFGTHGQSPIGRATAVSTFCWPHRWPDGAVAGAPAPPLRELPTPPTARICCILALVTTPFSPDYNLAYLRKLDTMATATKLRFDLQLPGWLRRSRPPTRSLDGDFFCSSGINRLTVGPRRKAPRTTHGITTLARGIQPKTVADATKTSASTTRSVTRSGPTV